MSKEMLGGCCVCSDERGWTENPLVYCDGQNCNVAVHQGNNLSLVFKSTQTMECSFDSRAFPKREMFKRKKNADK